MKYNCLWCLNTLQPFTFCCNFEKTMFKDWFEQLYEVGVYCELSWMLCECYVKDFLRVFLLWYINNMIHFNKHKQACAHFLCTHIHSNLDTRIWTQRERASTNSSLHMTQLEMMNHLATVEGGCLIYQQRSHHFRRLSIHMQCRFLSSCTLLYVCMRSMWNKAL